MASRAQKAGRAEVEVQDGGLWGEIPRILNLPSKTLIYGRERGKEEFSLKNKTKQKSHTKIDPFAKQFLSQEAPPPISLETEGEVLGWSQDSPYSR